MPDAHIEPREGTKAQAYAYVTKEETRVNRTIEINIGEANGPDDNGK